MGTLNNLNYIKSTMYFPCAQPGPLLMIETAVQAGIPTLLELGSWSCRDIMKLRAGISYRCGRSLKAAIKAAHGAAFVDKLHKFYGFIGPADRALWYWFVADLSTSFVAHWQSLVYQSQGCGAQWGQEEATGTFLAPESLPANSAEPVQFDMHFPHGAGGSIIPTGALVPKDWYVQLEFSVTARALFTGERIALETWVETKGLGGFEFGANSYPPANPGEDATARYKLYYQNHNPRTVTQFTYMAKSSVNALTVDGHCNVIVSPVPILDKQTFGVGCFNRDWSITDDPDPRGRGTRTGYPSVPRKPSQRRPRTG